jgi:hypothetical protein
MVNLSSCSALPTPAEHVFARAAADWRPAGARGHTPAATARTCSIRPGADGSLRTPASHSSIHRPARAEIRHRSWWTRGGAGRLSMGGRRAADGERSHADAVECIVCLSTLHAGECTHRQHVTAQQPTAAAATRRASTSDQPNRIAACHQPRAASRHCARSFSPAYASLSSQLFECQLTDDVGLAAKRLLRLLVCCGRIRKEFDAPGAGTTVGFGAAASDGDAAVSVAIQRAAATAECIRVQIAASLA